MKSRTWTLGSICTLFVVVSGCDINRVCGSHPSRLRPEVAASTAHWRALPAPGNTRGVIIFVTGTCRENIAIGAFDHLTLQASPVATIQDQTNGSQPVVVIFNSYDVALVGFTINGGSSGVDCAPTPIANSRRTESSRPTKGCALRAPTALSQAITFRTVVTLEFQF